MPRRRVRPPAHPTPVLRPRLVSAPGQLAETAPGFGDPFDVARACEQLGGIDLPDAWDPPHLLAIFGRTGIGRGCLGIGLFGFTAKVMKAEELTF